MLRRTIRIIKLRCLQVVGALFLTAFASAPALAGFGVHLGHHGQHHGHHGHFGLHFPYYSGYYFPYYPGYYRSDAYPGDAHYPSHRYRSHGSSYVGSAPEPAPSTGTFGGNGWLLLARGQARDAMRAFGSEARRHPDTGEPKTGYSLAAAAAGDLPTAVWAMRRSLRIDPDSLHYVTLQAEVRTTVEELVGAYEKRAYAPGTRRDAAFLTAALQYLLRDASAARGAIDEAVREGDRSPSAANLERMVRELETTGYHWRRRSSRLLG